MASAAFATKYFLDTPPTKDDLLKLPPEAREPIVAKVRLFGTPILVAERDELGMPPLFVPKALFRARIELLDITSGAAKSGDELDVFFGPPGKLAITPSTPEMVARVYFVVIFLDAENGHQLLGFPASQDEYDRWEAEWLAHDRMISRPGRHDQ